MPDTSLPQFGASKVPCDGCTACCHIVAIAELGKPERCDCEHLVSSGCGVYGQHPESCKSYYCGYALGLLGDDVSCRPDKSGILFHPMSDGYYVYLNTSQPSKEALRLIERLKSRRRKLARREAIASRPTISDHELLKIEQSVSTQNFTLVPAGLRTPLGVAFKDRYPPPTNTAFARSQIGDGIFVVTKAGS